MVRNYGNSAAKIRLIDELHEILESAEFDNDYWEAVESGKWPASRQIAERIIRKCNALEQIAG